DNLLESAPTTVGEAGDHLLRTLSTSRLPREEFLNDPLALVGPPYFASRYLAQVALHALRNEYETLDEVLASLNALIERNPPILEPKRETSSTRVVVPEAKVLELRYPKKGDHGFWESTIEALVTSGPLREREIQIRIRSNENRTACFLIPHLWIHAAIAAYNLVPREDAVFQACPETFIVLE